MTIYDYIEKINARYKTGISTEHSYRGDLQNLLESLVGDVIVTNEPSRIACGAPDYIITKRNIPIGYIEAKDIGADLQSKTYKEQFERYKSSLNNLIITDYLDFHLFREGVIVSTVSIGKIIGAKIIPVEVEFPFFLNLIKEFCSHVSQSIKSASKLSLMMAGKARLLESIIENALNSDEENKENSSLKDQMEAFKDVLIHDITPKGFADIYAQTIAYGMFAARLNDTTLKDFSRKEAAELIPKSNPFLRKLFNHIAGIDLDDRIIWIVDALAEIFKATNIVEILKDFGKATLQQDPMIHFYETFLTEYDPRLRKKRGVYYTPEPVVNFIVRALDDILISEFRIVNGLSDTSKVKIKVKDLMKATPDQRSKTKLIYRVEDVHKVQILDPAAGTGTFLAGVVKQIYQKFIGQQGIWTDYVREHLIPRINGFEILMAPYSIAHLKLDLLFKETGYKPNDNQRFRIYLTNSLEEHHPDTGTLFANWLSTEANEANHIKRDTPIMCILGNPPYSGESSNKGDWIKNLMEDYKKEPGGNERLKEKNSKWINADEYKFIRYGQHFIEKNGSGVLAFINPHSYLDNPTFRGMRWNLLKTYDSIYIVDLHGNSIKKETSPDGSEDENVFDITQGVTINIFIKTGEKKSGALGKVFHFDLYGKREYKYDYLLQNSMKSTDYKELNVIPPDFIFMKKSYKEQIEYEKGFYLNDLFYKNGNGIVSKRDALAFQDSKNQINAIIRNFYELSCEELKQKYNNVSWKSRDGKIEFCKNNVLEFGLNDNLIVQCTYRPFDKKWTYYTGKSKGFIGWPVKQIMQHYLDGDNIGLIVGRQGQAVGSMAWNLSFITNTITDFNVFYRGGGMSFPLYLYSEKDGQQTIENTTNRKPNFKPLIINQISDRLGLIFTNEKQIDSKYETENLFSPIDILDYIYAILYCPTFRTRYKEFLKNNFPRIPYPKDPLTFWHFVVLGRKLRQIHLFEDPIVEHFITQYPINGNNVVDKLLFKNGDVFINYNQHFSNVPKVAWDFYIGGYQPARKWLKDRIGKILSFDDIMHYQKIIVVLSETDKIMQEIDKVDFI